MSRAGILLRIVLGVSLVLNGLVGSFASTAMGVGPKSHAAHVDPAEAAADPGCQDHASAPHHRKASPATDPPGESPAGHADCCSAGICACACMQLSSLAAIELLFVPPALEHERLSDSIGPSRPSPVLSHLIRPPIA